MPRFTLYLNNSKKGFTLIEVLVSVAVFTMTTAIVAGLFITAVKAQRRTLAQQQLIDQTSFAIEYMSRALRTARKELNDPPTCLTVSGRGYNYEITRSGKGLKFINDRNECQEFFWDDIKRQLKEDKNFVQSALLASPLEVSAFRIYVFGASQGDNDQPRVTIFIEARRQSQKPEERVSIRIQTTLSQRDLDVLQ